MNAIRVTAKRQATLPKALCEEMRIQPGDALWVMPTAIHGERVWCLRPKGAGTDAWFARLRRFAHGKAHAMSAVRRSTAKARKDAGLR